VVLDPVTRETDTYTVGIGPSGAVFHLQ